MGMRPYEKIDAWKACHELALVVYSVTAEYPSDEKYGLTSQARRAAFSAAANIAEGCMKKGPREFRRFVDISLGSLSELSYNFMLAKDLGLLSQSDWEEVDLKLTTASKRTWGLYSWIQKRIK